MSKNLCHQQVGGSSTYVLSSHQTTRCETILLKVIYFAIPDIQDANKDTQKKSKRKGRNKLEAMTVNVKEPEPEAVKTPIDLMRVSTH